MAKVNRKWHDKNKMPKKATTRERVKWHLAHAKACACRPIPAKIQRAIDKKETTKPTNTAKKTTTKTSKKKK